MKMNIPRRNGLSGPFGRSQIFERKPAEKWSKKQLSSRSRRTPSRTSPSPDTKFSRAGDGRRSGNVWKRVVLQSSHESVEEPNSGAFLSSPIENSFRSFLAEGVSTVDKSSQPFNPHCKTSNDLRELTNKDFLTKINNILLEFKEEKVKKKSLQEVPSSPDVECIYESRLLDTGNRSLSQASDRPLSHTYLSVGKRYSKPPPRREKPHRAPGDILHRHADWFTRLKPNAPRILRSDAPSWLRSQRCYQPPRRPRARESPRKPETTPAHRKSSYDYDVSFEEDEEEYDIVTEGESEFESNSYGESEEEDSDGAGPKASYVESEISEYMEDNDEVKPDQPVVRTKRYVIQDPDKEDTYSDSDRHESNDAYSPRYTNVRLSTASCRGGLQESGETSVDSAYTGSRGATPDMGSTNTPYKPQNQLPHKDQRRNPSSVRSQNTFLPNSRHRNSSKDQLSGSNTSDLISPTTPSNSVSVTDALRRHIFIAIKNSGLYSDGSINLLLQGYESRCHELPLQDILKVTAEVRRELGVPAPGETVTIKEKSESENESKRTENIETQKTYAYFWKPTFSARAFRSCDGKEAGGKDSLTMRSNIMTSAHVSDNKNDCRESLPKSSVFTTLSSYDEMWAFKSLKGLDPSLISQVKKEVHGQGNVLPNDLNDDIEWTNYVEEICNQFNISL